MIERLIEDWLTSASERSLEIPFCELLLAEGWQVVHLSRHGEMEEGKDVIAIDPSGHPCAFQLKSIQGKRLTQRQWAEILPQITRLVEVEIQHPSVESCGPHRPYLVLNGELDETVRQEIINRNRGRWGREYVSLETITKGQLIRRLVDAHGSLVPADPRRVKALLELFLADGAGWLRKERLASFLRTSLPFTGKPSKSECRRALCSMALMCNYAISPFYEKENWVGVIEGLTVGFVLTLGLAEKLRLAQKYWKPTAELLKSGIDEALDSLLEEVRRSDHLFEGDVMVDVAFWRIRVTYVLGLLTAYGVWKKLLAPDDHGDRVQTLDGILAEHGADMTIWGEGAIPAFLALYWYRYATRADTEPVQILRTVLDGVVRAAARSGLPPPYYGPVEVGEWYAGQQLMAALLQGELAECSECDSAGMRKVLPVLIPTNRDLVSEETKGLSYSAEALLHLFVRHNYKQTAKLMWPAISRLCFSAFQFKARWHFYLWHCDEGHPLHKQPKKTQSWKELREDAGPVDTKTLPQLIQRFAEMIPLVLQVYPHRLDSGICRLCDDKAREAR